MQIKEATNIWKLAGVTEPVILASMSPRRAEILKAVGCPFIVVTPQDDDDDGNYDQWDEGQILTKRAVSKVKSISSEYPGRIILGADTVIQYKDRLYGKPGDVSEARSILQNLSGKTHTVWTAIAIIFGRNNTFRTELVGTQVTFRTLSPGEIETYVETGEPFGKAGAYGIQEIGGLWVKSLNGCYFNVVGLPVSTFWELLLKIKGDLS